MGDVCKFQEGYVNPPQGNPEFFDGDIKWLRATDLNDGYIYNTSRTLTELGYMSAKKSAILFEPGSIAISKSGTIGRLGILKDYMCGNRAVINIIPKSFVNTYFIFCMLRSFRHNFPLLAVGSVQKNLYISILEEIKIILPNLGLQTKIASILKSLDDKIEVNRRINDNLEQQAQALFKSWFVDFEPFKDGEFVESELGMIPCNLEIKRVEDIPHKIESGRRPKGGASSDGVPSIGAENIKGWGYYDYSKTKYIPSDFASSMNKGKINGYELLIYKDGGKPGYFIPNFSIFGEGFPFDEMYVNEHVFILDLKNKGYNAFAYFWFQTPYIMNQLNSLGGKAAIPGINTKDVEYMPIPSLDNMKVKEFCEYVEPLVKAVLYNSKENARLAELRDTLLPRLMSGELKINDISV